MDAEHQMLAEGIMKNRDLLVEIKEDLVKEINQIKLTQQKLKYYIYGVALGALALIGKPELVTAIFKL